MSFEKDVVSFMVAWSDIRVLYEEDGNRQYVWPRLSSAQKMKFLIKDFFFFLISDLVTFTEEIPNGNLHFLCSDPQFLSKAIAKCPAGM